MARYATIDAFRQMMRTGKRPDGTQVGIMPFANFKAMNDAELEVLFSFLKTLPRELLALVIQHGAGPL